MKKTQHLAIAAVLVWLLPVVLVAGSQQPNSGRQILDEMIEALGGQTYLDVREIHSTGRFYVFQRGELAGGDVFVDYIKFPDKERTEFGKDDTLSVQINNGENGWKVEGRGKDRVVTEQAATEIEEFRAAFRTSLDYLARFLLQEDGVTVQNIGSEMIDFNRADIIEIRDRARNVIRLSVNRATRLPIKLWVRRADNPEPREERYGNWHSMDGVMTPLFVSRFTRGVKTMEIRVETARYNSGLSDSLFAAPAGTD